MSFILTTCKNRRQHLIHAAQSWRAMLPGWEPLLIAVDDPEAVELVASAYGNAPWHAVQITQVGFSRLGAIRAGVDYLNSRGGVPEGERVAILDADVVALFGSLDWLSSPLDGGFLVAGHRADGSDHIDDMGQLLTTAGVLRDAFDLIGSAPDWTGYGWEDILIRAACWFVTGGKVLRKPALWAHIPHGEAERVAGSLPGSTLREQSIANASRFRRDLDRMAATCGISDWRQTTLVADVFFATGNRRALRS
jgi:hypothetical protein